MEKTTIVFNDQQNKKLDLDYANKVIEQFRFETGWKVESGTRIHNELQEFSKGYFIIKRDVSEVVTIFRLANQI